MATPAKQMEQWAVESGRKLGAMISFLYGVEGVGKSTFAKDAGATFADVEHGTGELDVNRFNEPEDGWTWVSILSLLRWLATGEHRHRAAALDTVDALESLVWKHVCARDDKKNIEEYGYGKGYVAALDEWKVFVAAIERVKARGIDVHLLAHAQVKVFKNPEGEDFDRYSPALHEKAAGLLKSRSDVVLFSNFEQFAKKKSASDKMEKAKGVSTGRRVIYTTRTAAYDAKNRYDLPVSLDFEWAKFIAAVKGNAAATPAQLRALIAEKSEQFKDEKLKADVAGAVVRAGEDAQKLRQLNNWTTDKLAELAAVSQ